MENQATDTLVAQTLCVQVVRQLRNLPGFQLLEEDDFVLLVHERENQITIGRDLFSKYRNAALNIYSECLYQAAADQGKPNQQEKGFQELSRYLYRMAYNFYLHQSLSSDEILERAQEGTQVALEQIYTHLPRVKSPGGFLKWCGVILRRICLEEARSRKHDLSIDQDGEEIEIPVESNFLRIDSECVRECLSAAISRLKKEYQEVIKLTYFACNENGEKLADEEIAATLHIHIGNLYTLRSRAVSALKKDENLYRCIHGTL